MTQNDQYFLYPYPYPSRQSSQDENDCLRAVAIDGTMIKTYLIVINLVHRYHLAENVFKKRRDNYQPKSLIFKIISEKLTKGQSRQLPFRLQGTISFSIDNNVNILSPNSKITHTNNNEKFRSFKSKENIHKKEVGPYRGFGY